MLCNKKPTKLSVLQLNVQPVGAFTLKARRSLPASLWLFLCDLTLKEEGVHDDKFKMPTVARAAGINLQ